MLTKMTEEDWVLVHEVFDACRSRRGDKGRDDRKFLEALHYFTVHNITWRGLPAEFGSWNSIWKRFWRLSRQRRVRNFLRSARLLERASASRADVRLDCHPRACVGGRRKRGQDGEALGRSRGGFSTKIHLKTDLDGYPIGFHLTGGEASDSRNFEVLLDLGPDVDPRAVVADKGYDAKTIREAARNRGICPVIPYRSNTIDKPKFFAKVLYKARARIEQMMGKIKRFKRIALRCEKTARNYASFLALVCGFILIKSVHTA
jgi:transposase